ncbi:hypothetical protein BV511_13245 [Methylorubrum extorquens]|uniref:hypothetical protein n=1 Tax=Methylorubrum extorquens TaxID=408 RepID=UPI000972E9D3|nr:hypothetical protein [Methylorubrum extorquens]APX85596.1 hypothetical protein BV511_13245 [Methylorubrum extorquens]
MPSFLSTVFGRKKPTVATAASAITDLEAQLQGLPGRIAEAQAKLENLADLTDEEHAAAEADIATAGREEARLKAQIEQLRTAHASATKTKAAAVRRDRAEAAQKRVDRDHLPLIERYEAKAREIVEIAEELRAIEVEVEQANRAIAQARRADPEGAHPDPVVNSTSRFRLVPDVVEPDKTIVEEKWFEYNVGKNFWDAVGVYTVRDGKKIPNNASAQLRKVERVIKGETRKGRQTPCPTQGLRLPGARLDAPSFWPKQE